jgi:hypothetical protein
MNEIRDRYSPWNLPQRSDTVEKEKLNETHSRLKKENREQDLDQTVKEI